MLYIRNRSSEAISVKTSPEKTFSVAAGESRLVADQKIVDSGNNVNLKVNNNFSISASASTTILDAFALDSSSKMVLGRYGQRCDALTLTVYGNNIYKDPAMDWGDMMLFKAGLIAGYSKFPFCPWAPVLITVQGSGTNSPPFSGKADANPTTCMFVPSNGLLDLYIAQSGQWILFANNVVVGTNADGDGIILAQRQSDGSLASMLSNSQVSVLSSSGGVPIMGFPRGNADEKIVLTAPKRLAGDLSSSSEATVAMLVPLIMNDLFVDRPSPAFLSSHCNLYIEDVISAISDSTSYLYAALGPLYVQRIASLCQQTAFDAKCSDFQNGTVLRTCTYFTNKDYVMPFLSDVTYSELCASLSTGATATELSKQHVKGTMLTACTKHTELSDRDCACVYAGSSNWTGPGKSFKDIYAQYSKANAAGALPPPQCWWEGCVNGGLNPYALDGTCPSSVTNCFADISDMDVLDSTVIVKADNKCCTYKLSSDGKHASGGPTCTTVPSTASDAAVSAEYAGESARTENHADTPGTGIACGGGPRRESRATVYIAMVAGVVALIYLIIVAVVATRRGS